MRLNRFIASSGRCARRRADELINAGRVQVNGQLMTNFGYQVQPGDQVLVDGQIVQVAPLQYIKLHKPPGFLTTMQDDRGRPTIYRLLPPRLHHLRPAGRLDFHSSGLLILSNDGDFLYQLTHPGQLVARRYLVSARGRVTDRQLQQMRQGIRLLDQQHHSLMAYAQARLLTYQPTTNLSWLQMILYQGLNRQIRRMLEALGHPVVSLQRITHGPFQLGHLPEGQWCPLQNPCGNQLKVKDRDKKLTKN